MLKNSIIICHMNFVLEYSVKYYSKRCYTEDQKARVKYDNILRLSNDPDANDAIKFLREREVVHFQRFGEAVDLLRNKLMNKRNIYAMNPAFDLQRSRYEKPPQSNAAASILSRVNMHQYRTFILV